MVYRRLVAERFGLLAADRGLPGVPVTTVPVAKAKLERSEMVSSERRRSV